MNKKSEKPQPLELHITEMHPLGQGIARTQKGSYLVPRVIPGEDVLVLPLKKAKNFTFCELIQVITPSALRIEAPCEYFDVCGGCDWQQIDYNNQLQFKEQVLENYFKSIAVAEQKPIIPSKQIWNYRNRITLHKKQNEFGFFKRGSEQVVPISSCQIASEKLNQKIQTTNLADFDGRDDLELREDASSHFVQVNPSQNQVLQDQVKSLLKGAKSRSLLELYGGAGNLTWNLIPDFKSIDFVEADAEATAYFAAELKEQKIKKVKVITKRSEDALFDFVQKLSRFDVILCDPPRSGLGEALRLVLRLASPVVLYVSCDPARLAKEALLFQKAGYTLKLLQPIDMFPQTHHLEVLALFTKEG